MAFWYCPWFQTGKKTFSKSIVAGGFLEGTMLFLAEWHWSRKKHRSTRLKHEELPIQGAVMPPTRIRWFVQLTNVNSVKNTLTMGGPPLINRDTLLKWIKMGNYHPLSKNWWFLSLGLTCPLLVDTSPWSSSLFSMEQLDRANQGQTKQNRCNYVGPKSDDWQKWVSWQWNTVNMCKPDNPLELGIKNHIRTCYSVNQIRLAVSAHRFTILVHPVIIHLGLSENQSIP
jgi:hypothetical protein